MLFQFYSWFNFQFYIYIYYTISLLIYLLYFYNMNISRINKIPDPNEIIRLKRQEIKKKKIFNSNLTNLSNIAFLAPIYCSYKAKAYYSTTIFTLAFLASFLYHNSGEKEFKDLDSLLAKFSVIHCFLIWISYHVNFNNYSLMTSSSKQSIICALLALGIYRFATKFKSKRDDNKNYSITHSLWHIMAAVSATLLFC